MSLLHVENLQTVLDTGGSVRPVDGVTFDIARGETFALLGESGCGKSLTALSIMRLLPEVGRIAGGLVRLQDGDALDLLALPETAMRNLRGKRMAMIFQEPAASLNPVMTVGEQIAEVLERHAGLRGEAQQQRVLELLDAVGISDAVRRARDYPFQMSGGMKQRVMIAIALACAPDLLIADEPTTALDVTIQAQVLELLRELQHKNGMALLLITHDLGVVAEMAHRVAVMYAGEIVEIASREQFFSRPLHPYTQKLFAALPQKGKARLATIPGTVPMLNREFPCCRFADRCEHAWALCREQAPAWTLLEGGRGVRCHLYEEHVAGSAWSVAKSEEPEGTRMSHPPPVTRYPLLQVESLRVHFPIRKGVLQRVSGYVKAVDGVSFDIAAGRTLALVGESGCGKTTVGKSILRLIEPSAGTVRFGGENIGALRRDRMRMLRSQLQIIFQDPYASLNPRMRVAESIEEGMAALETVADAAARMRRVDELLAQVGLSAAMKYRYPHEFSGGQRQRIAIARALAVRPRLIVCDEPTSALDVSVQAQILNLLKQLQDELGLAYLFITHNIAVVEFLAHEVAVMYLGRIVECGSAEEILNTPRHPYTQALLSAAPRLESAGERRVIKLSGELPSPINPPPGCHFHPRCPHAMPQCRGEYPQASRFSATHHAHCYLYPSNPLNDGA
ncbi:MAG: ABC transporter ATP-binding protein [Pseudomonadota bacterium]